MSNLEQFIIKSLTVPNWILYLIAMCITMIILGVISEFFKIDKILEGKPRIDFIFNISCIILPLLAVLLTYYIKPEYKTLESLNQYYNIRIFEGDNKILLEYKLKEDKFLLSSDEILTIGKEKINGDDKYYVQIGAKRIEVTPDEIKDIIKKSKNTKIKEKLTLKDLGENND